ncbi:hypothetical protein Tcan_00215 [Toxocara canis]|uniref:Uncharacterized protein n=1 Tax=Toxocara canis TaxID=6265 RepID=A0A0B2UT88_TOXCA|nr:hypothetical protein Tcan_00215 [Toxocara canis]
MGTPYPGFPPNCPKCEEGLVALKRVPEQSATLSDFAKGSLPFLRPHVFEMKMGGNWDPREDLTTKLLQILHDPYTNEQTDDGCLCTMAEIGPPSRSPLLMHYKDDIE